MNKQTPKSWWTRGIVIFFIFLAIVEMSILYLAISTYPGLIEENPYEKGIAYQQTLDKINLGKNSSWEMPLKFSRLNGTSNYLVTLRLTNDSEAISGAIALIKAKRPADSSLDTETIFVEKDKEPGSYIAKLTLPETGLWFISLQVTHDMKQYLFKRKEFIL